MSDLVELNMGGTLFTTNRATLEESQPQSMLAALVSGRHGPPRRDAKVRWYGSEGRIGRLGAGGEEREGHVGAYGGLMHGRGRAIKECIARMYIWCLPNICA